MSEFITVAAGLLAIAGGAAMMLLVAAAFVYVLLTFIRSGPAHADGEVDARHGHRDHDYYRGVLRWAYERGRAAHETRQRILAERHNG